MPHCIYLHGFASGPSSTKAKYFSTKLRQLGMPVQVPDMNGSNFSDLTITNQLQIVERAVNQATSDVVLFGSSMGGLLSVLSASRMPQVKALVLLAPGFGLNKRWMELLGEDQFAHWAQRGALDVFHHGAQKTLPLNYAFIEDAKGYQTDNLTVAVPTLVMHGIKDEVVPVEESISFAELNPGTVELHTIDSDHALTDSLPQLWDLTDTFMSRHHLLDGLQISK